MKFAALLCLPLLALACRAPLEEQTPQQRAAIGAAPQESLLGEMFDFLRTSRQAMWDAGIELGVGRILDVSQVVDGGIARRGEVRGLATLGLGLDLDELAEWRGASVRVGAYGFLGDSVNRHVGALQDASGIDVDDDFVVLSEFSFEQRLGDLDGDWRFKLGKWDQNDEFMAPENASEFLHNSAGYSPTHVLIPTYPDPAWGFLIAARPVQEFEIGAAVFDAERDRVTSARKGFPDFSSTSVIGHIVVSWGEELRGRVELGAWAQSGEVARFDGGTQRADGRFAVIEQSVWADTSDDNHPDRRVALFAQIGQSDDDFAALATHLSFGVFCDGVIDARPRDRFGVYASWVKTSDAQAAGFVDDELAIEALYSLQFSPWLTLKPDLQWIHNPGGRGLIDDALVASLRIELWF